MPRTLPLSRTSDVFGPRRRARPEQRALLRRWPNQRLHQHDGDFILSIGSRPARVDRAGSRQALRPLFRPPEGHQPAARGRVPRAQRRPSGIQLPPQRQLPRAIQQPSQRAPAAEPSLRRAGDRQPRGHRRLHGGGGESVPQALVREKQRDLRRLRAGGAGHGQKTRGQIPRPPARENHPEPRMARREAHIRADGRPGERVRWGHRQPRSPVREDRAFRRSLPAAIGRREGDPVRLPQQRDHGQPVRCSGRGRAPVLAHRRGPVFARARRDVVHHAWHPRGRRRTGKREKGDRRLLRRPRRARRRRQGRRALEKTRAARRRRNR